uniref:Uncharacterized protein n=1 Tax=Micrurus lemniscatus lemniscatus TaxID=129467 RepID=A0A2D4HB96_MICLE
MAVLLEELKMELKKMKEESQEGRGSVDFALQFLEMEILNYEKQQETLEEQEGLDKEEAIFNDQTMQCGTKWKRGGGKGVKNLSLEETTKKKNSLKSKYNIRKKQKRGLQKGE